MRRDGGRKVGIKMREEGKKKERKKGEKRGRIIRG